MLDVSMAGMNGLEAAARLTAEFPAVRIIMLSMHDTEQYVSQALRAGARGYLLKDSAPTELEVAIRAVARGESYLSPAVSEGKTTKEIAQTLGISVRTAETHRLQLMSRLNTHNVAGLVRYAARAGLVNLE
jgi:DNA-binding NarL/FixJ family response regulator